MTPRTELLATVTTTSRATMDHDLNMAVHAAMQRAIIDGRRGILVTQLDHGSFAIELTEEVPYGYTYEKRNS